MGKTLKDIPLPAAVIDIAAVRRNCQRMSDAVKDLGFDFVPLVNVHKVGQDVPNPSRTLEKANIKARSILMASRQQKSPVSRLAMIQNKHGSS
jgi:hypothetical protein